MSVKITTGEYTEVVVANHKSSKDINVVQQLNMDASAKTEEVRAFNDLGEPLVISTDMGQTTGSISILKSSSTWFENIVLGEAYDAAFTKFSLKDAIQKRFFIFANYKDKQTQKVYQSMEAVGCVLNSDGSNEAVNGTLQSTFNVTATAKNTYPYKIVVEKVTSETSGNVLYLSKPCKGVVSGGKDDSGADIPFIFKTASATYDGISATLTVTEANAANSNNGSIAATGMGGIANDTEYIVAYLVEDV